MLPTVSGSGRTLRAEIELHGIEPHGLLGPCQCTGYSLSSGRTLQAKMEPGGLLGPCQCVSKRKPSRGVVTPRGLLYVGNCLASGGLGALLLLGHQIRPALDRNPDVGAGVELHVHVGPVDVPEERLLLLVVGVRLEVDEGVVRPLADLVAREGPRALVGGEELPSLVGGDDVGHFLFLRELGNREKRTSPPPVIP